MISPHPDDVAGAAWRKSSRSSTGECVEVASLGHRTAYGVRDSKTVQSSANPPVLAFPAAEWGTFLRSIRT